jgi:hypothetical protein
VVSFLSPSLDASRRASQRMAHWTGWKPILFSDDDDDDDGDTNETGDDVRSSCRSRSSSSWNQALVNNAFFAYSQTWYSRALQCPTTGTVLHWISLRGRGTNSASSTSSSTLSWSSTSSTAAPPPPHQLLAIQQAESLAVARDFLAKTIQESSSKTKTKVAINSFLGRSIQAKHLIGGGGGGGLPPLLKFMDNNDSSNDDINSDSTTFLETRPFSLKEIAISDHHEEHNSHESNQNVTLLQRLSNSTVLARPVTGLYQVRKPGCRGGGGVCLRPLPTGRQDWQVAPPSLVFHVDSLESSMDRLLLNSSKEDVDDKNRQQLQQQQTSIAKIGYNGMTKSRATGQLMLRHVDLTGIDVRFCQATTYSSMFAEAQESLLAGSLHELQSSNHHDTSSANLATTTTTTTAEPRKEEVVGHCWAEFHANMKHPLRFISKAKQASGSLSTLRRAKPPDLPFE